MFVISIVILSILVQMAAAYMALRLIKVTQNQWSWIFIAVAMVLQASRRALTLIDLINGQLDASEVQTSELIGLVLSVLMAVGVGSIEPFFLAQARSIVERKQAGEKLREASLYTRNLIESSLDPNLVTISSEGKITDVNKASESITGVSREQLIGSDFSVYLTEPEKAREGFQQVLEKGLVKDYLLAIRHTSGRITDVHFNATVYKNEAGEIQGVFAAARDITERKREEEALQMSETMFRELYDNMKSGSAIFTVINDGSKGSDYIIKKINSSGLKMEGKALEEVVGKRFIDIRPTIDSYGLIPLMKTVWETGKSAILPTRIYIDEHYTNYYENYIFKLPSGEVVTLYNDVTESKRAEEALRESEAMLNETQRLTKVGGWEYHVEKNKMTWTT